MPAASRAFAPLPDAMDAAATLCWEDFAPGRAWSFGNYSVTAQEIMEFARRYDPMPMHVDPDLALKTPLGMFCASGVHTFAMTQKMAFDHLYSRARLIAGAEVRHFVMRRPVVPGDVLSARTEVVGREAHRLRADAGWVDFRVTTSRADARTVLEYDTRILFERRSPAAVAGAQAEAAI